MLSLHITQSAIPLNYRLSASWKRRIISVFSHSLPEASGSVQVIAVSEDEIRRLNRMYRDRDCVTDVLSFPSGDSHVSGVLGDVLLCYAQAERQAGGDIPLELTDLIVHGILHILGYDHETPQDADRMFPLQDHIVAQVLSHP